MAGEKKEEGDSVGELCKAIRAIDLSDAKLDLVKLQQELKVKVQGTVKQFGLEDAWNRMRSMVCYEFSDNETAWKNMLTFMAPMFGPDLPMDFHVSYVSG